MDAQRNLARGLFGSGLTLSGIVEPMNESLSSRRRTAEPVVLAIASLLALVATIHIALGTSRGQRWDQHALDSLYAGPDAKRTLLNFLGYVSIGTAAVALLICAAMALMRGRVRLALGATAIIAGANITTQVLKHEVLDRPDLGLSTLNSLPSGHTTVVTSVVLATLLVAPATMRTLFATAGSFAVALTGAATVAAGWHRPGDVIAALAVCLLWSSAVALAIGVESAGSGPIATSLLGAVAAGAFIIVVGVRPTGGWEGIVDASLSLGVIGLASAAAIGSFARCAPIQP